MKIANVLAAKGERVVSLHEAMSLRVAADRMMEARVGSIVVVDRAGEPTGVLAERDVVRAISKYGADALEHSIGVAVSAALLTCSEHDDALLVAARMTSRRLRHALVVREGRLAGVVSMGDLVKARVEDAELEVRVLREYAGRLRAVGRPV